MFGQESTDRGILAETDGALVGFGGDQVEGVAAVLVYRFLTIFPTLVIGLLTGVTWKRYMPAELPGEIPAETGPPPGASL